jgi:hypothetical protein
MVFDGNVVISGPPGGAVDTNTSWPHHDPDAISPILLFNARRKVGAPTTATTCADQCALHGGGAVS